jgi:hypothetical protein
MCRLTRITSRDIQLTICFVVLLNVLLLLYYNLSVIGLEKEWMPQSSSIKPVPDSILTELWKKLENENWDDCAFWREPGQWFQAEILPNEAVELRLSSMEICKWLKIPKQYAIMTAQLCSRYRLHGLKEKDIMMSLDIYYDDGTKLWNQRHFFQNFNGSDDVSEIICVQVPGVKVIDSILITLGASNIAERSNTTNANEETSKINYLGLTEIHLTGSDSGLGDFSFECAPPFCIVREEYPLPTSNFAKEPFFYTALKPSVSQFVLDLSDT